MRKEAIERISAVVLQRVYRGHQGRKRLCLKRVFIKTIADAKHAVSLHELLPGIFLNAIITRNLINVTKVIWTTWLT